MRKLLFSATLFVIITFFFAGCSNDDSLKIPQDVEVKDFVWKGLNLYYLWQADSPDLQDDRFSTQNQLNNFLRNYSSPEALFGHLTVDASIDRFSVITSDYMQLEAVLGGTERTSGVDYQLFRKTPGSDDIFGFVRYILPNTDASTKPIARGDIFYAVNGTPLTVQNQSGLLGADSFNLNMANYDGGTITPNGISISLTKANYSENPIYLTNTIDVGDKKVGYLMYNAFTASFDGQLNQTFGQFQAAGITHLVVDLRYNSGGSVTTATRLASMITGQFTSQIFAQQQWNQKVMDFFNENNPEQIINRFTNSLGNGAAINSLNLQKVYFITSNRSASASELLIHNLKPYVDVTVVGNTTTGKNVGSIVLYDSP
ncbi:MAG: S41 family peptidase, partial [Flavobacterium sp.]